MATPASRYRPSLRPMPERIEPPDYEPQAPVRKVQRGGFISFRGHTLTCAKAFEGRRVAMRATDTDGVFDLCYRHHGLTQVDLRQNTPQPVHHLPEQVSTLSTV